MTYTIPASHYDADLHAVPYTVGADFVAKRDAYAADGFTYGIGNGVLLVIKLMAGQRIPRVAVEHR